MHTIREIKENLTGKRYDEKLAYMYGLGEDALTPCRERILRCVQGYLDVFGKDDDACADLFSAPGRTEIGGNHTDHQRGKVLAGSVDLDALACASENGSAVIRVYSEGYGMHTIDLSVPGVREDETGSTNALIRGVAEGVKALGYPVSGFDAYVVSDVPGGSGLSSSACFEVLIGTVVNTLFCAGALTPTAVAQIGQLAENRYFGKPSGLLDQMTCAVGGIVAIDFKNAEKPEYHAVNVDFAKAGFALCIVDTGADHADLTQDYAAIPREMKLVAAEFGKEVLSEVEEEAFYARIPQLRTKLGDRAVLRAVHFFADCRRVDAQVAALERGDFDSFLSLVNDSGRSSFSYLQNVSTFRDPGRQPVAAALALAEHFLDGKGACRVHGGGFAGTIQAFVPVAMADDFRRKMDAALGKGACRMTLIRPVGCCTLTE